MAASRGELQASLRQRARAAIDQAKSVAEALADAGTGRICTQDMPDERLRNKLFTVLEVHENVTQRGFCSALVLRAIDTSRVARELLVPVKSPIRPDQNFDVERWFDLLLRNAGHLGPAQQVVSQFERWTLAAHQELVLRQPRHGGQVRRLLSQQVDDQPWGF